MPKRKTIEVKAIRNTTFAKLGEIKEVVDSDRIRGLIEAGYLEEVALPDEAESIPEDTSEDAK